jgi:hypothetical protein
VSSIEFKLQLFETVNCHSPPTPNRWVPFVHQIDCIKIKKNTVKSNDIYKCDEDKDNITIKNFNFFGNGLEISRFSLKKILIYLEIVP